MSANSLKTLWNGTQDFKHDVVSIPEADMQNKYKQYLNMTQNLSDGMSDSDFSNKYGSESKWMQNYAIETQNSAKSMEEFAEVNKKAKAAQDAANNSMQTAGLKSKLLTGGMQMLGSALQGAAVGLLFFVGSKVVESISNYANRVKIANEEMRDAVSSYGSAKSNLDDINSKLEENKTAMAELQAKGNLTYAEKGQLEELQAITQELEIQRDIAENDLEKASREAAAKAVDAYDKQYGSYDISSDDIDEKVERTKQNGVITVSEGENDISGNLAQLKVLNNKQNETEEKLKDRKNLDASEIEFLEYDFDTYTEEIRALKADINTSLSDLEEKRQALKPEYKQALEKQKNNQTLLPEENDALECYEKIEDHIRLIYEYTDKNKWNSMQFSSLFNTSDFAKNKEQLLEMSKAGTLTEDALSAFPNLKSQIEGMDLMLDGETTSMQAFIEEVSALADEEKEIEGFTPKLDIAGATKNLQKDLAPALSSLQSAYENIFTADGFTLENAVGDVIPTLQNELEKIEGLDTSAVEDLFATLASPTASAENVQEAFNQVAASFLYSSLVPPPHPLVRRHFVGRHFEKCFAFAFLLIHSKI